MTPDTPADGDKPGHTDPRKQQRGKALERCDRPRDWRIGGPDHFTALRQACQSGELVHVV